MKKTGVFILFEVKTKDETKFQEYLAGYPASMKSFGGEVVFASRDLTPTTGTWPKGNSFDTFVLQRWPNQQAFNDWQNSKEYAPWLKLREEAIEVLAVVARK